MTERRPIEFADVLMIGGGLALVVAPFLPFASAATGFGSISSSGVEMIGGEALVLTGLGAAIAFLGWSRLRQPLAAPGTLRLPVIAALIAGALTAFYYWQLDDRMGSIDNEFVVGSIGIGMWLAIAGVAATLIGAVFARPRPPVAT